MLPINLEQFNGFLEEHIESGIVPTVYTGDLNLFDDGFWLLLHNYPLAEQDCCHATIIYLENESKHVINQGVLPMLHDRFSLPAEAFPGCIERFSSFARSYIQHRFMHYYQTASAPVTVTCHHATMCITFYPHMPCQPILIRDGTEVYIVPERVIPGHCIDDKSDSKSSHENMEMASMAISGPATASAFPIHKIDPSLEEIGDPCDLDNYLPNSGAMQHMTT